MGTEIERKYLVVNDSWRAQAGEGVGYRQGYLSSIDPESGTKASVRVRIQGDRAFLNIKSATLGIRRMEYEYPVPVSDAQEILENLCVDAVVTKTRYHLRHDDHLWEIDLFDGDNKGLVVAEIELNDEKAVFSRPDWVGDEVSHDTRYYNVCLARHPFKDW